MSILKNIKRIDSELEELKEKLRIWKCLKDLKDKEDPNIKYFSKNKEYRLLLINEEMTFYDDFGELHIVGEEWSKFFINENLM